MYISTLYCAENVKTYYIFFLGKLLFCVLIEKQVSIVVHC